MSWSGQRHPRCPTPILSVTSTQNVTRFLQARTAVFTSSHDVVHMLDAPGAVRGNLGLARCQAQLKNVDLAWFGPQVLLRPLALGSTTPCCWEFSCRRYPLWRRITTIYGLVNPFSLLITLFLCGWTNASGYLPPASQPIGRLSPDPFRTTFQKGTNQGARLSHTHLKYYPISSQHTLEHGNILDSKTDLVSIRIIT
ncbi:hypothetical protein EV401DRAFT_1950661 [Pisolithus croceorrhizus]|nr:hypothetical protein EV401DRAFT_1950661 [Pisolithus croceorrhizus]